MKIRIFSSLEMLPLLLKNILLEQVLGAALQMPAEMSAPHSGVSI